MRKKILIVTGLYPPDVGGPATYTALIEKRLTEKGFIISVFAFREVHHFPVIIRHMVYGIKMLRLIFHNDVVFAQDPMTAGIASIATLIIPRPFYARVTGDYAWEQGTQRFGVTSSLDDFNPQQERIIVRVISMLQRFSLKRATIVVVPSEYLKKIVKTWGVVEKKIQVIYNAIDIPTLSSKLDLRRELQIDGKVIISAGRFVPWKNFDVLIKAFSQFRDDKMNVRLIIAGDGPQRKLLLQLVHELQISDRVLFTGSISNNELHKYLKGRGCVRAQLLI